jgi:ATP-dependent DNA helicase DinG
MTVCSTEKKSDLHAKVKNVFSPTGPLSLLLKGYETRECQQEMSLKVLSAFEENATALIEAGTGTGKSFAYLIPAILWAENNNERIVISTNTIALQEQLVEKDIPFVLKVLQSEQHVCLAKGMGNYVCLRKLDDRIKETSLFQEQDTQELLQIEKWSRTTRVGSKAELSFFPSYKVWEQVAVEADACNNTQCSFYNSCFLFKARRELYDAKVIICNHHLLFADLAVRAETGNYTGTAILPAYQRLILDEAHHAEDVATEYFAERVSRLEFLKIFSQLSHDKPEEAKTSKLTILKKKLLDSNQKERAASLITKLDIDFAASKREVLSFTQDLFDSFSTFFSLLPSARREEDSNPTAQEKKLRIRKEHFGHPFWMQEITPKAEKLKLSVDRTCLTLRNIEQELELIKDGDFQESSKSIRLDITANTSRLQLLALRLANFINPAGIEQRVRWIEIMHFQGQIEVRLNQAEQDVSKLLRENLFDKLSSTVLCSATLSTQKKFEYMKQRLGLKVAGEIATKSPIEAIYESPFDFGKQAIFGVPVDMPTPDDPKFFQAAKKAILELVEASNGNAFVLFTSYTMMKNIYEFLYPDLKARGYHTVKQGDDHKQALLKSFKEKDRSVLFGVDSFWEGVDVVGDALRLVIIVKLPFQVPTEPIAEVRAEAIASRGGNPFVEYTIPKAVVKFKQAFGRLIRHRDDRGCVICLDVRLVNKSYGKLFFDSLPGCTKAFEPLSKLADRMKHFYRTSRK